MRKPLLLIVTFALSLQLFAQKNNVVTYAGGIGIETFYDVTQVSDGSFLVVGYADNLDWVGDAPKTQLSYATAIPNALGTHRYGFILQLSSDLQTILQVVHFAKGAVEDVRFIKTNSLPYSPTGDLFISCNIAGNKADNSGYIIAKLNKNFVKGVPTTLTWATAIAAKSIAKEAHPWDVTSDGKVYYISGAAYSYEWSAVYCLNNKGQNTVVENWRTHWLTNGKEWRGTPASTNPTGSLDSVSHSGIVLKIWGRCDLRSWTAADYNALLADENGGKKKGKWPLDILFSSACNPQSPTADSPGYTGYSASPSPVYGGSSITVDRRNNDLYIGMNFKSVLPSGLPDFEPAVIAMDATGNLKWWSRQYHEITPKGDTANSTPDQYVDALAIDYTNDKLVVGARCHGNNVENFWKGNKIAADECAYGFQNNVTGTSGNIHISWLGKLQLNDGKLTNATYMAELAEGTGSLGKPLANANLDGWPDPNGGWPNVNSTRMAKNGLKVSSNGDVCVLAVGRRTITTANAYQKMVKPGNGGLSCWNSFVRVYDSKFNAPKYSSLIVGAWDTLTQSGGDNTEMFGVFKTSEGVVCVGRHKADISAKAIDNAIPVANVTPWGNAVPKGESAILVYYKATNLVNQKDNVVTGINQPVQTQSSNNILLFPNPAQQTLFVELTSSELQNIVQYRIIDIYGRVVKNDALTNSEINISELANGVYQIQLESKTHQGSKGFTVLK